MNRNFQITGRESLGKPITMNEVKKAMGYRREGYRAEQISKIMQISESRAKLLVERAMDEGMSELWSGYKHILLAPRFGAKS